MRHYFSKYQWGNTTIGIFSLCCICSFRDSKSLVMNALVLHVIHLCLTGVAGDFLGALEFAAKQNKKEVDLKRWSALWLETAGLNTLRLSYDKCTHPPLPLEYFFRHPHRSL
jgi:hypothetical protein